MIVWRFRVRFSAISELRRISRPTCCYRYHKHVDNDSMATGKIYMYTKGNLKSSLHLWYLYMNHYVGLDKTIPVIWENWHSLIYRQSARETSVDNCKSLLVSLNFGNIRANCICHSPPSSPSFWVFCGINTDLTRGSILLVTCYHIPAITLKSLALSHSLCIAS